MSSFHSPLYISRRCPRGQALNTRRLSCPSQQPGKPHSTHRSLRQARRCLFLETVSWSLKKNYRALTGSVYREPAELKILLYFGMCYENISACTTDSLLHLTRRTRYFFIYRYVCELESVGYRIPLLMSLIYNFWGWIRTQRACRDKQALYQLSQPNFFIGKYILRNSAQIYLVWVSMKT